MATKITVTLEDDLDGGPAAETVRFAVGGTEYEIDLNKKNAAAFRKKLAPFVEHARRAGRGPRRGAGRSAAGRERGAAIRAWAAEQGSRSAAAGASRRVWWRGMTPLRAGADAGWIAVGAEPAASFTWPWPGPVHGASLRVACRGDRAVGRARLWLSRRD